MQHKKMHIHHILQTCMGDCPTWEDKARAHGQCKQVHEDKASNASSCMGLSKPASKPASRQQASSNKISKKQQKSTNTNKQTTSNKQQATSGQQQAASSQTNSMQPANATQHASLRSWELFCSRALVSAHGNCSASRGPVCTGAGVHGCR